MTPTFYEPTKDDYTVLAKRWMSVQTLIKEEYGGELDQTPESLPTLQRTRKR